MLIAFADSGDQDQIASNLQSDLRSSMFSISYPGQNSLEMKLQVIIMIFLIEKVFH